MTTDNTTTPDEQANMLERILHKIQAIEHQVEHLSSQLEEILEELEDRRHWSNGGYDMWPPEECNDN